MSPHLKISEALHEKIKKHEKSLIEIFVILFEKPTDLVIKELKSLMEIRDISDVYPYMIYGVSYPENIEKISKLNYVRAVENVPYYQ